MLLTFTDGHYVAESDYSERMIPKSAGFTWNRIVPQRWATDDPRKAVDLAGYADEATRALLEAFITERNAAVEASRAVSADVAIPAPEGREYLPYQRAGIAFAASRQATLIADEMGLGKTIQALGIINLDPTVRRVLVICPASLKFNWKREAERWLVNPLPITVGDAKRCPVPTGDLAGLVVLNDDNLHKHAEALRSVEWDLLVADEVHREKNPKARRSVYLYGGKYRGADVAPIKARRRVFMSGTPIVNRPVELWPIINALDPLTWDHFFSYAKRYCGAVHNGYAWDFSGASNLDELQEKLRAGVMVRRRKAEVLTELPAKRRQIIELPRNGCAALIEAEERAYAKHATLLEELRAAVELAKVSDDPADYAEAVEALRKGTTACFTEISRLRHETALAKVPYVVEHLTDAIEGGDHKVVVFAHHKDVVAQLAAAFGETAVQITGDTPITDRQAAVDRFQTDPTCLVFIGNIQAAGVGITLTASAHVVMAELDWVPGNITQAEDRCHRIGQVNSVLVQHLVFEGSLDAVMAERLVAKQKVIDAALDDALDPTTLAEPILPTPTVQRAASEGFTRKQLEKEAHTMPPEQVAAIHTCLQMLAGVCDFAQAKDDMGFNGCDARIGHSLAARAELTPRQAALGRKIIQKYHRQLPKDVLETARGTA